jgi:hypothetical protein
MLVEDLALRRGVKAAATCCIDGWPRPALGCPRETSAVCAKKRGRYEHGARVAADADSCAASTPCILVRDGCTAS